MKEQEDEIWAGFSLQGSNLALMMNHDCSDDQIKRNKVHMDHVVHSRDDDDERSAHVYERKRE